MIISNLSQSRFCYSKQNTVVITPKLIGAFLIFANKRLWNDGDTESGDNYYNLQNKVLFYKKETLK